jgi:Glyoxalase superfamily protein
MSQIEKLKAEADELESHQRALGDPIKHCEALEHVAKKHGYSSWRACRAMLGDESDKPDTRKAAPPMQQYRSSEWNFSIDFPAHWNIFPPVPNNSPYEAVRFASKEEGDFHIVIVFRQPRDPKEAPTQWLADVQQRLEQAGFGNFKTGEALGGRGMVPTLDFEKPRDGRTWSCREYFFGPGRFCITIGFGSNAPEKVLSTRDRMVQSFEVLPTAL